jgi:hypothetical protein
MTGGFGSRYSAPLEMHDRADKAAPAVGVPVVTLDPAHVVGEKIEQEIEQLHGVCWFAPRASASPDGKVKR